MSKDYSPGKYGWNDAGKLESTLVSFERQVLDPLIEPYVKGYTLNLGCGPDMRGDVRVDVEKTEATTVVADARNLPFPAGYFDTVLIIGVLHHITDYEKVVAEACRVSRMYIVGREPNILSPHVCTVRHFLGFEGECPIYIPKVKKMFEKRNYTLRAESWNYGLKLLGTITKQHMLFYNLDPLIPNELRAFWSYIYVKH